MRKALAASVMALTLTATAASARCPTLSGFAAFKRCYLAADSAMDLNNLQTLYEQMQKEDRAKIRAMQYSDTLNPLGATGPLSSLSQPEITSKRDRRSPLAHQNIEEEIWLRGNLRQQQNGDAARAQNQFQVDRGRARSQDLFYGTSGN